MGRILSQKERFTPEQRGRKICTTDVALVFAKFGPVVGAQLQTDHCRRYRFWDSCSMIEGSWEDLRPEACVDEWVAWAFKKLHYEEVA